MNFLISLVGLIVAGLIVPSEQFFQSNQTSDELTLILENLIEKHLKAVETNLIQAIDDFASQVEVFYSIKANEKLDESMIPNSKLIWQKITTCLNDLESYMKSNGDELVSYQELVKQQQESKELVNKYKKLVHRWIVQLKIFLNWELEVLNNQNKNYDWSKSEVLEWKIESQGDSIVKLDKLYSNGDESSVFLPENDINKIIKLQTEIMKTLGSFASSYRKKIAGRFKIEKMVVIDKKKPIVKKNLVNDLRELNKKKPFLAPFIGIGTLITFLSLTVGLTLFLTHDSLEYDPILDKFINPRTRLNFHGTTPLSLSPESFYMYIILVLILVVICTIVAFFLYRKKKAKSKLNRDNKELKKTNYHRSHSRHSSNFPSHHGSRFGRSSAFESRMSPIHSGDRRHRQMSSIPSHVPSSRMSSIPSNVPSSRMSSIVSNVPSSRMSSIQSNVPGSRMSSIVSNIPNSRMSSIQSNVPNSRMSTIPRNNVPNNRMSPPIPNNPTYIILPPIQTTGPNYQIPSKANVEPFNRIPPNANVAPIYRIPSTTNDRPNLRMPSNTNVGPNLRILSNTNDRPNLRIPSNTNVGPNIRIPSNTNVGPNLRIPSNTNVGPNLRIPSNTNVGPNLRIPSNTNAGPNLRIPSNIKVGPNDKKN